MSFRSFFLFMISIVFCGAGMLADDVFISKPVKKQSNSAIKEKVVYEVKHIMREFNNMMRTISLQHDALILALS